jgi:hypothetical protein
MAKYVDIKVNLNFEPKRQVLKNQIKKVEQLPQKAADYYKSITPIDTGNARKNTKLEGDKTIHADYAYAQRLDQGWSKQAPKGMTKPTEQWLKGQFKKIFKK